MPNKKNVRHYTYPVEAEVDIITNTRFAEILKIKIIKRKNMAVRSSPGQLVVNKSIFIKVLTKIS